MSMTLPLSKPAIVTDPAFQCALESVYEHWLESERSYAWMLHTIKDIDQRAYALWRLGRELRQRIRDVPRRQPWSGTSLAIPEEIRVHI
jgi:hypothetical protein